MVVGVQMVPPNVGQLSVGVQKVPPDSGQLSVGVQKVPQDVRQLSVGVQKVPPDSGQLSVGVQKVPPVVGQLSVGVQKIPTQGRSFCVAAWPLAYHKMMFKLIFCDSKGNVSPQMSAGMMAVRVIGGYKQNILILEAGISGVNREIENSVIPIKILHSA